MRTIEVRLTVDVSGDMTVAAVRDAIAGKFGTKSQRLRYPKGTMPDPDTQRAGVIHWGTAKIKQRRGRA